MKRTLLALAAATLVAGSAPPASAAVETTDIKPATLDRGAPGTAPHVQGDALVVGERRYVFSGRELRFLGSSDGDYVVETWREGRPASDRIVRVTTDDERFTAVSGLPFAETTLGSDGEQIFYPRYRSRAKETRLSVYSSHDGSLVAHRTFDHYVSVLDAGDGRAVLATDPPLRTFWWNLDTDRTRRIVDRAGYRADIAHDLLATFTKDPYLGGCSVLSTLSHPAVTLWRSCDQAVTSFSPSGTRVATTYLLADGLGPGDYELHRTDGTLLARYATGWFDGIAWESDRTLLMRANGKKKSAWVRCTAGDCERTSRLTRSQA